MDAPPTRSRSRRDRPAKAPLSERAIVEAALEVCRADGIDAVTMRRVAAELDTGAASLYVYVRNREELLGAMGDRVAAGIELEAPDPVRWRDQLHRLLGRMLDLLESYPGLAAATLADVPSGEPPFEFLENLLGLLVAGGVGRQDAAWGCDSLFLLTTATAIEHDVRRERSELTDEDFAEMVQGLRARFATMGTDRYPHIVAHADEMVSGDGHTRFAFAIDTMLDGMIVRAQRARG